MGLKGRYNEGSLGQLELVPGQDVGDGDLERVVDVGAGQEVDVAQEDVRGHDVGERDVSQVVHRIVNLKKR